MLSIAAAFCKRGSLAAESAVLSMGQQQLAAAPCSQAWERCSLHSSAPSYSDIPVTPDPDVNPEATPKVMQLVEEVENLTVKEMVWFTKILQTRLGISDAELGIGVPMGVPMAAAAAPAAADAAEEAPVEEKTAFDVIIEAYDASAKIKIIKEVRAAVSGLGLKEGKELVEKLPATIKAGITKDDAAELEKKLAAVGATVKVT